MKEIKCSACENTFKTTDEDKKHEVCPVCGYDQNEYDVTES